MPTQRELDHELRLRRWQVIQNLGNAFLRSVCWIGPFFFLWLAVRELAGRSTFADIGFKALADLKINQALAHLLPWGATTAATGWAVAERRARKKHIKRETKEVSILQSRIDPERRSSSLTVQGDTSPEDA